MKTNRILALASLAAALTLGASQGLAQDNAPKDNNAPATGGGQGGQTGGQGNRGQRGRGGFNGDPAQFQQMILDRLKTRLEITNDDEWKAIEPLIQKVLDVRREQMTSMGRGMFGRGPGGGGDNAAGGGDQNNRRGGPGGGGQSNPEADALQKAIDAKASSSEMKAAMAKYVESRKEKQQELETAQANLRKVLTVRQEAVATLSGLL